MSLLSLISHWKADPTVGGSVAEWRTLPPRPARFIPVPEELHPDLRSALQQRGIRAMYLHQAAAWNLAQQGRNLVIVTGTASGKTLCYNLPVINSLMSEPEGRALYIFPTKALAQDQKEGLQELTALIDGAASQASASYGIHPTVYDGDTPSGHRPSIRDRSRVILSNPDMLHTGILPHHTAWAEFFRHLRFVVIDEMHTYRGVFGSHVANVLRRLKRVAAFYGAFPQFILTSATIGNPKELAGWLIEEEVELIDEDGSARGEKHFLIYNPPIVDRDLGLRRGVLQESVRLAEDLLEYNVQTILFGRTRRSVELLLAYLRSRPSVQAKGWDRLNDESLAIPKGGSQESIQAYRSGYLPRERRAVERGLKQGEVRAVAATTALELGIDIGGMGASILAGYPGSIAGTWQQAGRAGRGEEASLAVLVTSANPLDQFLAHHPAYFFERSPEQGLINPDNLLILMGHLRCAAFELPFNEGENFGSIEANLLLEFLELFKAEGILHQSGTRYFWMADRYPAESVSLRSASPEPVLLQVMQGEGWHTIGQVDLPSAPWMVHPGAVYMHQANTYIVEALDLEEKIARLKALNVDYYTQTQMETSVQLIEKMAEMDVEGGSKAHGELAVTSHVTGFRKIKLYTHENLGSEQVLLPPSTLQTTGYWLSLSHATVERLSEQGVWSNAPINYGANWQKQRLAARARDGYRCQMCGASEKDREHDVHHMIPFRQFMRENEGGAAYEQANHLSNLITLCPPCHKRAETAVRVRSGLAGLAFTLGNLAPLFLMCDSRDLGIHSDAQAAHADGQPSVVIYDQVPAGLGFGKRLYEIHEQLLKNAYNLVSDCSCSDGCPSCVGPGGENGSGGKRETLALLEILGRQPMEQTKLNPQSET
jgi:DEAD/DEAH box helicase domain-containing protein